MVSFGGGLRKGRDERLICLNKMGQAFRARQAQSEQRQEAEAKSKQVQKDGISDLE